MAVDTGAAVPVASVSRSKPVGNEVLVSVRGLKKHFPVTKGVFRRKVGAVRAVDGVSFDIRRGETLGLVGESGSGKSTIGRTMLQLEKATEGSVVFDGIELVGLAAGALRRTRPRMQMVFQDPHASLNPRMTVSSIVGEPLLEHGKSSSRERQERVEELLGLVGLDPTHANRYPHEFSGGQRQRIGIARAIALNPDFIVCDEPIAALDVSIQAQVVNLMEHLQDLLGLTYLFISHDLGMVRHIADRVAVMYLGHIMELADVDDLYGDPRHPYTRALQSSAPVPDPVVEATRVKIILEGDIPSPSNPPPGCPFNTRCPDAVDRCHEEIPAWREVAPGHGVACHLADG
ncbi:MAG: oligopeptide/dipeptide ABC transporter ATP-binding protein [Actinomycetota bacterium]|nr:ATP-binding cassette domain-containing protein [Acidimicrobiales bacterium]MDG2906185.1 ATP-binding cassette domain-containing protein [Acidimicrobiales bacterium]MED5221559.1 oligopeptide/dipeptide ABC transporter ATP-binding protein [Actinomycetota bacterium]MED5393094.1 oligopeptide/dipeptide ABC transporter ATP-binding protein [Actinomycetota bacterium]